MGRSSDEILPVSRLTPTPNLPLLPVCLFEPGALSGALRRCVDQAGVGPKGYLELMAEDEVLKSQVEPEPER